MNQWGHPILLFLQKNKNIKPLDHVSNFVKCPIFLNAFVNVAIALESI